MNKIESERSSKDNEERGRIEEGAHKNFGFSKFANKRSFKKKFNCKLKFNCVAVVAFFGYYFLDIPPEPRVA